MLSFSQKSTAAGMIIFMIIIMVTLLRCYALFVSPLDLSVDEAQYWLWSQTPDAGYFTKPPMIAWVISIGTNLAGAGESGIRLMAPLLHGMTAVILWQIAAYLYHPVAGRLVALGWISLPAVGLASFVMSTDTPLLLFTSTMILVLSPLAVGRSISITGYSLAGIMLGLGFLSKYAAIYSLISIALIWIFQPQIRRLMRWPQWGVLLLSAL
ncbi:MAG: ArnT family glycosyltransferase, partial [Candidatus Puniceispirillales bacterium]